MPSSSISIGRLERRGIGRCDHARDMSDDDEFLEDFVEQIKSSRENALAGKYEDALAFYDGCCTLNPKP